MRLIPRRTRAAHARNRRITADPSGWSGSRTGPSPPSAFLNGGGAAGLNFQTSIDGFGNVRPPDDSAPPDQPRTWRP